jgi:hypothetical protein
MRDFRIAGAAGLILACCCNALNSYIAIENRSGVDLVAAAWVFAEKAELRIELPVVPAGKSIQTKVPSGIGETSVSFYARMGSTEVVADCGYLESDGHYRANVVVQATGAASCTVGLDAI